MENGHAFIYPIIDAILGREQSHLDLVHSMTSRELFSERNLINRQRECPTCSRPHLELLDQCPRCQSIQIDQKPFLHCFSCGKVSPQDEFLKDSGLSCPNCQAVLRRIGTDYDRPFEHGHCSSCDFLFEEPEVLTKCLVCSASSAPSSLKIRQIYELELTQSGHMAARNGGADWLSTSHEEANVVPLAAFRQSLAWTIRLSRRHPDKPYSVIYFKFEGLALLSQIHGVATAQRMAEDLITRIVPKEFCAFFPNGNAVGAFRLSIQGSNL
jgi:hypothetical protein